MNIEILLGQTLKTVKKIDEAEIIFVTDEDKAYKMYHMQDCCEEVYIEDICGDLEDLVGEMIVEAEEVYKQGEEGEEGSCTWTFYKLRTKKGCVTIRWFGQSNGYYSETADFEEIEDYGKGKKRKNKKK